MSGAEDPRIQGLLGWLEGVYAERDALRARVTELEAEHKELCARIADLTHEHERDAVYARAVGEIEGLLGIVGDAPLSAVVEKVTSLVERQRNDA